MPKTSKQGGLEFRGSLLTGVWRDEWWNTKRSKCFFRDNNKIRDRKTPRPGAGVCCSRAGFLRYDTASPLQGHAYRSCKLAVTSKFRSCVVRFGAGTKPEESLQEAHVEEITVTHWIYHEHTEKKLFNADVERHCDVFCSYLKVSFLYLSALIQIPLKSIAVSPFRRIMPLNSYFRKCTLLGDNTKQRVDD